MTTNDTAAVDVRSREAELLQAMAAAGDMHTQAKLAAELESLRARRREAARNSIDLNAVNYIDRFEHNPNPASIRTSAASDWLMSVPIPQHTTAERDRTMIAEASLWYTHTTEAVRGDHEEFDVQALGISAELASQFGDDAAVAQRTFLDHVGHLAGRKVAEDILTIPVGTTQTAPPPETTPMDQITSPADTGPVEVDHSSPSDNPSLSEGTAPAGDSNAEPVSQSATENNAGDSGDPKPTVDNTPANPTVLPPASRGAKRQALLDRVAKTTKCRACGEAIHKDPKTGNWTHSQYLYQRGHKRTHLAAPDTTAAKTAAEDAAADTQPVAQAPQQGGGVPGNTVGGQYQVSMKHSPSGASYSVTVQADSPDAAIAQVRSHFANSEEASNGDWVAKRVQAAKVAVAPTEDGLNSAVDFAPDPDPSTSMSLGEDGEDADWPAPSDGDPQTMTNPTVSTAALFDVDTDRRVASATEDHELMAQASGDGTFYVDGDLTVIAAEIADEPYVQAPVRRVYLGVEASADPSQLNHVNPQHA